MGQFKLTHYRNKPTLLLLPKQVYTAPDQEPNSQVYLYQFLPPDAVKIVLVLFLSFLIGLERE